MIRRRLMPSAMRPATGPIMSFTMTPVMGPICYETCRADCYEMAWYPGCESDAERYDKVYHSDYQKYFDGDAQDFEIYVLGCKIDPFATV